MTVSKRTSDTTHPINNEEAAGACDFTLIRFYGRIFKATCKRSAETSRLRAAVRPDGKSRGTQDLPGRAAACLWFQGERKKHTDVFLLH